MKVSIITVSYNSDRTIRDTIESVKNQTYRDIEYILVDGSSRDGTVDIIKEYEVIFKSMQIQYRWVSERDKGIYDAINKGITMASGDIIGILNSDDYYYDTKVIYDVANQFESKNIDCLYGNIIYVGFDNGKKLIRRWMSKEFKPGLFERSWTPGHPTFYCKKEIYNKLGLYRIDFKIAADVELMYRFISKNSVNSIYYDRYMVVMRHGGVSSRGLKSTITITKEVRLGIKENGGRFNIFRYMFFKLLKIKEYTARISN